jgi:hypothetical protein
MLQKSIPIFLTLVQEEILSGLIMNLTKKQLADYFHTTEENIDKQIKVINEKIGSVSPGGEYYFVTEFGN